MKASIKLDNRTLASKLAMSEIAEKTKELTIELHLAAFSVAIALVLGSRVPILVENILEVKLSPADIVCIITASGIIDRNINFWIDESCLAWGLVIFLKYLKTLKGFGLNINRSNYFSKSSIPSLGRWISIQRGVFIESNFPSYETLAIKYAIKPRKKGEPGDKILLHLIKCVKDELLNHIDLKSQCDILSDVCPPIVCAELLRGYQELMKEIQELKVENENLITERGKFNDALRDTLRSELEAVHDKLVEIYGNKASSIASDPGFTTDLVHALWNACVCDQFSS